MSFVQILPKSVNMTPKSIVTTKLGFFVDNSGSTHNLLCGQSILSHELYLVKLFNQQTIKRVTWNTKALEFSNNVYSNDGTSPSSIFENPVTELIFDDAEVIIFMTDGEIDQSEVTRFAQSLEKRLNKLLI